MQRAYVNCILDLQPLSPPILKLFSSLELSNLYRNKGFDYNNISFSRYKFCRCMLHLSRYFYQGTFDLKNQTNASFKDILITVM